MSVATMENTSHVTLRPAADVLSGRDMGGAWPTRHSFSRSLLRRAINKRWKITRDLLDLNENGHGRAVYTIRAEGHVLTFVAFSQVIDDIDRTDRVIANTWDVTAALIEGPVDEPLMAQLQHNVPIQESGRFGKNILVLTRANRSVRFFDYVRDRLMCGQQPEPSTVGPSPYLLRSTAFYSNGKFGLSQLGSLGAGHPMKVPYRAQMLAAWLLRELSMDIVEDTAARCSRNAVALNDDWRRYFGLGNATGLGMVPFIVNHPGYLDAWCHIREIPLARALDRVYEPNDHAVTRTLELVEDSLSYLTSKYELSTGPFMSIAALHSGMMEIWNYLNNYHRSHSAPVHILRQIHDIAATNGPELRGLVASIIIEIDSTFDSDADDLLTVNLEITPEVATTCGDVSRLVNTHYSWACGVDFDEPKNSSYFWYSSADSDEPRRAPRVSMSASAVEHCTDIARRINSLINDLDHVDASLSITEFLLQHPNHRFIIERVQYTSTLLYGEFHENLLDEKFLPLNAQRFQLAMYGMANFSPQSTDWLRVTLFSGSARISDVNDENADDGPLFPQISKEAI